MTIDCRSRAKSVRLGITIDNINNLMRMIRKSSITIMRRKTICRLMSRQKIDKMQVISMQDRLPDSIISFDKSETCLKINKDD